MHGRRAGLRVVHGSGQVAISESLDPDRFQTDCVDGYVASWVARGFSQATVDSATARLERVLAAVAKPAWEVTREDMDRVVGTWAAAGIAPSTRRGYVQAFKGFHEFLAARKANSIEAAFGVRLESPLDEFNAARHVGNESASAEAPPTAERMEEFFDFLRDRVATARKFGSAGRDYALFRPSITPACAPRRRPRSNWAICTSGAVPSASFTCASARAPRRRALDRGGCRCSTGWI